MKTFLCIVGGLAAIVVLVALAFVLELGGLQWRRFFAPKHEEVRREVFEETRSFNEAKIQDLARYKLQYDKASDPADKEAIASAVRVMFADYDSSRLPAGLASFLKSIRSY